MSSEWATTVYGPMPKNLDCAKLGELCVEGGVQTGPFGSQLHQHDYVEHGTPIITVEHLGDNRVLHSNLPMVSASDEERLSKFTLLPGDIIFSRVGSVDRRALVQKTESGWLFSGRCLRVRPRHDLIDSAWLSYFFGLPTFRNYIRGIAVGATMPSLNTKLLSDVPIYFPPIRIQREASRMLGHIDDRITLLRETNATLEAIAQSLFKSWFVDFDPVRAKTEGRSPDGMSDATAALFPDGFEESVLGLVPKGWRVGAISDLAKLNPESWTARNHPSVLAYVDLANTKENVITAVAEFDFDQAPSRARRVLRDGDTIVGTVRPGNRSFAFIREPQTNLTGSTGFAVLRPIAQECAEFVYLAATQESSIEYLTHVADGAAYPAIRPDVVAAVQSCIPPNGVLQSFHDVAAPLLTKVADNQRQAQTLATLRDALLPRLISGQLRLPEAEAMIAEAAA